MATLKEIIYNIKNLQGRGEFTDDLKLSDRQLEFIINHFRAELAAQKANTGKSTSGFYQQLTNLKLNSTKDFRPHHPEVKIFKSDKLPAFAKYHKGSRVHFVGTRDGMFPFQQSEIHTFNIDMENPYVMNTFFNHGGYLYICTKNTSLLREVYVEGVFDSPREVAELEGKIDPFDEFNWHYPIPNGVIGQLNNLILNNEYRWMHILNADTENNGKDDKN